MIGRFQYPFIDFVTDKSRVHGSTVNTTWRPEVDPESDLTIPL